MKSYGKPLLDDVLPIMKVIGHETRLSLIEYLSTRDHVTVKEILAHLKVGDACGWFHLNKLRAAGVVRANRADGSKLHVRLDRNSLEEVCLYLENVITGCEGGHNKND